MNVYYNVEIQMSRKNRITEEILNDIALNLGATASDVDERETYRAVLFFKSEIKPGEMRSLIRAYFRENPDEHIHYFDVIYRWETEMNADRFVIWSDGETQEFTGKMIFEEDTVR